MTLITASQVIGFALQLEERSAGFYLSLADKFPDCADALQSHSKACRKHAKQIERAYRGVISDALETGFAFDICEDDFPMQETMTDGNQSASVHKQVRDMEEIAIRFYRAAAHQSASLLADIPKLFLLVAERRERRLAELDGLVMIS